MPGFVTHEELGSLLGGDEKPIILDVRRKADFEDSPGKIVGAEWFDPSLVGEWGDSVPLDRPVVVYCVRGGSVSQSVAEKLSSTHPDVRFLQGGITSWIESGGPVER
ncbi:MAG: rhodanese-like domain-containing protein [Desulfomonilaceae bacterium]